MNKLNQEGTLYASDKVGFGIYHFAQGGMDSRRIADSETFALDSDDRVQCDRQEQLDYMNFTFTALIKAVTAIFTVLRKWAAEPGCITSRLSLWRKTAKDGCFCEAAGARR